MWPDETLLMSQSFTVESADPLIKRLFLKRIALRELSWASSTVVTTFELCMENKRLREIKGQKTDVGDDPKQVGKREERRKTDSLESNVPIARSDSDSFS